MPWIAVGAAWALTVAALAGTVLWISFSSDSFLEEIRTLRPQVAINVTGPRPRTGVDTASKPGQRAIKKSTAALHPHPDLKLVEQSDIGMLPIIGADGRQAWRVYSRPFNVLEKRPKIAIVLTGLGISTNATENVLSDIPGEVSLAFAPFSRNLLDWIAAARGAGHEVLIDLPMEPGDYPRSDPGPYGLLTELDNEQNLRRLETVLSRVTGYIGVANQFGGKFTPSAKAMRPILGELKKRGLMYVDTMRNPTSAGPSIARTINLPHAVSERFIDDVESREEIDRKLAEIETSARLKGRTVAFARAYPVTLQRLKQWMAQLPEKGLVLAPVSAVAIRATDS